MHRYSENKLGLAEQARRVPSVNPNFVGPTVASGNRRKIDAPISVEVSDRKRFWKRRRAWSRYRQRR